MSFASCLLAGIATVYAGVFVGQPLYCDRGNHWRYDDQTPSWVAVDVREFESGRVQCGDEMVLYFSNGNVLRALALDAGPLYGHVTVLGGPIVADVPEFLAPFEGLSRVTIVNHSAACRLMEQYAGR